MTISSKWPLDIISGLRCYTWLERQENKLRENMFPWYEVSRGPEFKPCEIWHFKAMYVNNASSLVLPKFCLSRTNINFFMKIHAIVFKIWIFKNNLSQNLNPETFNAWQTFKPSNGLPCYSSFERGDSDLSEYVKF